MEEISPAAATLLRRLAQLAPLFTQHAAEAERTARLPDAIAQPLLANGFFRLWIPASCGGLELSLQEALRIYEAAAAIDGSVGWAVMIGTGGGLFAAYLPLRGARELFGPPAALVAGSGAAAGRAEPVPGGYRASGRWRYASGAHHASVFTANCVITREGRQPGDTGAGAAAGTPRIRAMSFAATAVVIQEAWDTSGMRGTGSHDFEVHEVFVPEHHTFSVSTDAPREPGPLYRLPFQVLTELPVSAVALGVAAHALELFAALARRKKGQDGQALSADATVRARYAEGCATLAAARAGIMHSAREAWAQVSTGAAPGEAQLAHITAQCALTLAQLRGVVGELAALCGMSAIEQGSDFARAWRDLQALGAHASVSPRHLAAAGGVLLQAP